MSDPVITSAPKQEPSEPFSERWGLSLHYGLRLPIATTVSEGGLGHTLGVQLDVAENFEKLYPIIIEIPFGTTEQTTFVNKDAVTFDHDHFAVMGGLGSTTRSAPYFGDGNEFKLALFSRTTPLLGGGKSTITRPDSVVDYKEYDYEKSTETTVEVGTNYGFGGEFRPWGGRGPVLNIGPSLYYGLQYAGENSDFNRIKLELRFMAQVGFGDGSHVSREEGDGDLGAMGIVQGIYATLHAFAQRYMLDLTINNGMDALKEYDLLGDDEGATDRGSMADVPLLTAGSMFLSGSSSTLEYALRSGEFGYWGFGALNTAGGIYFLAAGSGSSKGAGLADILGSARLLGYVFAGINTSSKRLGRLPEEVERRQKWIDFASYLLNAGTLLIGAAADSDIAMSGGTGANMGVAISPAPVEDTTVVRTDIAYIPYTGFWGHRLDGNRAGIRTHTSLSTSKAIGPYFAAELVSPMLILGNVGNMPSEDEGYDSVMLTSDVFAAMGLEWRTRWTRLSAGVLTCAISGDDDVSAGVGGEAGFDLILGKEDGLSVLLGAHGALYSDFEGANGEIKPVVGLSF